MRYISLFSGVEAASVAWHDLGWEPVAFSEIEPFPCAVLAHRFPDVPNLGDIRDVDWSEVIKRYGSVELVVGGSPCQSFSIAGGRDSLDGESRLMFEYIRAVRDISPRWLLWENVPGVLSTRDNAFGQLLSELSSIGYSLAWRVFDAQFFGVAQRRRRVFLVGYLGNGGAPAAVLFERDSVRGNNQTSKQKRKALTASAEKGARASHSAIPINTMVANRWNAGDGRTCIGYGEPDDPQFTLSAAHEHAVMLASGQSNASMTADNSAPSLTCLHEAPIVIDRASFSQGINAKYEPHIEVGGAMDTLISSGPHAVCHKNT